MIGDTKRYFSSAAFSQFNWACTPDLIGVICVFLLHAPKQLDETKANSLEDVASLSKPSGNKCHTLFRGNSELPECMLFTKELQPIIAL